MEMFLFSWACTKTTRLVLEWFVAEERRSAHASDSYDSPRFRRARGSISPIEDSTVRVNDPFWLAFIGFSGAKTVVANLTVEADPMFSKQHSIAAEINSCARTRAL